MECESLGSSPGVSIDWEYERAKRLRKESPARRSAADTHAHAHTHARSTARIKPILVCPRGCLVGLRAVLRTKFWL